MRSYSYIFGFILFSLSANAVYSQHLNEAKTTCHEMTDNPHFRAAVLIGHTYFPTEQGEHLYIPSFGLDLEYWWSQHWGIGLHNDIEVENFEIISANREVGIERSYPLVSTLDILYKPWKELVLLMGPGIEADNEQTFGLVRFGMEYEWMITKKWDVSPSIFYDTRFEAFDSWSIALGFGRHF